MWKLNISWWLFKLYYATFSPVLHIFQDTVAATCFFHWRTNSVIQRALFFPKPEKNGRANGFNCNTNSCTESQSAVCAEKCVWLKISTVKIRLSFVCLHLHRIQHTAFSSTWMSPPFENLHFAVAHFILLLLSYEFFSRTFCVCSLPSCRIV